MMNRTKFFTCLFAISTFSLAPLSFCSAEEMALETSEQPPSKRCGSECTCGCVQGKECTCNKQNHTNSSVQKTPSQIPYNQLPPQQSFDYSHQEYNHTNALQYDVGQYSNDQYGVYQDNGFQSSPDYSQNYSEVYSNNDFGASCCDSATTLKRPLGIDINGYMLVYEQGCNGGIWLPDDPELFRPFMADPRQVTFSAGWRFNDNALTKNIIDVSYGNSFPIYRWLDVGPWHGQLQVEIEGALWAVFNPCYDSAPLINADYYGGMFFSYAIPNWQFRLRGYHISSHIGDEFLLNHPHFNRKNPSAEYVDFFISHDLTEEIRIYGGLGAVVAQDKSFHFNPFYSALGAELRLLSFGFLDSREALYGCPIFGMHFRQSGDFKHHVDATYVLGYEFGKLTGLYRRWRLYMEYHDGYSVEGQFSKHSTNYFSVRTSYGF